MLSSCSPWASRVAQVDLPQGTCDLSSPASDGTCVPCLGGWIPNHCTPGQAPDSIFIELLTRATLCALRKEGLSTPTYVVIPSLHLLTLPLCSYRPTGDLVKNADVDLGGLRWGLRACFPDKVPGEATAAGVWTVPRVSRL